MISLFFQRCRLMLAIFLVAAAPAFSDQTRIDGTRRAEVDQIRGVISSRAGAGSMTLSRSNSTFHRRGTRVFASSVVGRFRGVVSQGDYLISGGSDLTGVRISPLDNIGYSGEISVQIGGSEYVYPLQFEDLLPLALLADAGVTSVYSLTSNIRDQSAVDSLSDWASEAGMVVVEREDSVVALELYDTRFYEALKFIDLCQLCEGDELPDLAFEINRQNGAQRPTSTRDESWIITDVLLPYELTARGNELQIDISLTRNRWQIGANAELAYVLSATVITPEAAAETLEYVSDVIDFCSENEGNSDCIASFDSITGALFNDISLLGLDMDLLITEDGNLDFPSIIKKSSSQLEIAELAFETLALFRRAKDSDSEAWQAFVGSLSTDYHMSSNIGAWRRYASALQLAYP